MTTFIARNIVIPIFDLYRGTNSISYLKQLKLSQWLPPEKLLALQNERLNKIISHAYDNVSYYRGIFDDRGLRPQDIKATEDLTKLPILTRALVRKNIDNLLVPGFPAKKMFVNSTSGSTGEPLQFYSTCDDFHNWGFAAAYRAYEWAGYDMGVKNLWLRGKFKYKSAIRKYLAECLQMIERTKVIDPVSLTRTQINDLVNILEQFQPAVIRGYAAAISILANYIERELRSTIKLKAIISTGEQLYDYQRNLCSRIFNCDVYNHYGTMEVRVIASECSEHSGLHIAAENVIVEVVDSENRQVPIGEEGKILVTNLHNYAMPFIRYEIGDVGALAGETCPCGRGLPLLSKLSGRTADVIITPGGKLISGTALIDFAADITGIAQFQIVQEDYGTISINVIMEKKYSGANRNEIMNGLINGYRNILSDDMDITVNFVDLIEATQEGKRRFVLSKIKAQ